MISDKIQNILSIGFSLHEKGINNWVLNQEQSVIAIEQIRENNIPILGGDTYLNGTINPCGDSWSVEKKNNENLEDYVQRCAEEAIKFVTNPIYSKYSFILVPDSDY